MASLHPLSDWQSQPGDLTLWRPSAASLDKAQQAKRSPVPPSYEQAQHLVSYRASELQRNQMTRLIIVVWEEEGQCDHRAMTMALNAHLQRHDTYHSRFEEADGAFVRHVVDATSPIEMAPLAYGQVAARDLHHILEQTPSPFEWDCFRFGVLQHETGFTCFACVDHVNGDVTLTTFVTQEIHADYLALIHHGALPDHPFPGHYLDYCTEQRNRAETMTISDPNVSRWIAFLNGNEGRMPPFVLPLGILEDRCNSELICIATWPAEQVAQFELACQKAGARFIGGLLACIALAERDLIGSARYSVVTAVTTRRTPEAMRTAGWCTGLVPIDIGMDTGVDFQSLAYSVQAVFDTRIDLSNVPIERVIELAANLPSIRPAATGGVMLSYVDTNMRPLGGAMAQEWHKIKGRLYLNAGTAAQVAMWFFRTPSGMSLTIGFPANETARLSVQAYVNALKQVFSRIIQSLPEITSKSTLNNNG